MEINAGSFQYYSCLDSAFKSLSRSLKVMETFRGFVQLQENRASLSRCIDSGRLRCRIHVVFFASAKQEKIAMKTAGRRMKMPGKIHCS